MKKQTPPVSKNDSVTLDITAMGSEGQGIGRLESGYAMFVPGALPGESVQAHVIKATTGYGVGKLTKILTPCAERTAPRCPAYGRCGGCTLQHADYRAQLSYKHRQVCDALMRLGGLRDVRVEPVIGMEEPWGYRNKGSFPFAMVNGKVEAGFFAPRSHRLIPITDCPIQPDAVMEAVLCVRDWANEYKVPAYDEETHKGCLRHAVVRETKRGEVMAVIVTKGTLPHGDALIETLKAHGVCSILHNRNDRQTNVIFGRDFSLLYGKERLNETICGLRFSISGASFLQVNPIQTEKLYQAALDMLSLTGNERVLDLYCGIGTISLMLARHAGSVIGIETVPQAIEDAKKNAIENGISNAAFVCSAVENALPALVEQGERIDAIVLDPPRKGVEKAVVDAIVKSGVETVVYVSCNPATLARDCALLCEAGYAVKHVQPVDMFPHSAHVETVILLSQKDVHE